VTNLLLIHLLIILPLNLLMVTTVVVFGASGDLAKKKTYPALCTLHAKGLVQDMRIIGYARSKISNFREKIGEWLTNRTKAEVDSFVSLCSYISGAYDSDEGFLNLRKEMEKYLPTDVFIFYLATPPNVFGDIAAMIVKNLKSIQNNPNIRVIIEKPFGRDLESYNSLGAQISNLLFESEIYRIDHYLGKEMVKNIMVLRFANTIFTPLFSNKYINNIQITFKEPFGTEGRGGYFNDYGIIRDVLQNHLTQILTLLAMERPKGNNSEDIRNEKVKVLKSISPPDVEKHVLLGQYTASSGKPGYLDDETVPKGSNTPTYAVCVLFIDNERWKGVPWILKAGKALDEQKGEIRLQFNDVPNDIFEKKSSRNELVIRLQPKEAIYMKMNNKMPGFGKEMAISELDLTYKSRYDTYIPEAYESLVLEAIKGDSSNFVRNDELEAAWKIYTPLLHSIDEGRVPVEKYIYGSRGPESSTKFIESFGFIRSRDYVWTAPKTDQKL
jgi:glucose-6-phosphate 1-dehydrogenase